MKKHITIFLASSIVDLSGDHIAVGDFVNSLNDIYEKYNLRITLIRCDSDAADRHYMAGGTQKTLNKAIEDSDLCFVLFFKKAGEVTIREFELARDAFVRCGRPKVFTYFKIEREKDGSQVPFTPQVQAFADRLDKEMLHYYSTYENMDALKLGILMQIEKSGLTHASMEFSEDRVTLDKVPVSGLSLSNIPLVANNEELKRLRREQEELRKDLEEAAEAYRVDTGNRGTARKLRELNKKLDRVNEDLLEISRNIFGIVSGVADILADGTVVTVRLKEALRAFDEGDYEKALDILDEKAIRRDLHMLDTGEEANLRNRRALVEEIRLRVRTLLAGEKTAENYKQAETLYELAVEQVEKRNLPKDVMYDAASFMKNQNHYRKAIEVGEKLRRCYDAPDSQASEEEKARLWNLLGMLYAATNRLKESEERYEEALKICRELSERDPETYLANVAGTSNNLGILYSDTNRLKESEERYEEALKVYRELSERSPEAYLADVADTSNNLGILYAATNRLKESEERYEEALKVYRELSERSPEAYLADVAITSHNLGILYQKLNDYEESARCLRIAYAIAVIFQNSNAGCRQIYEELKDRYSSDTDDISHIFKILYEKMNNAKNAEERHEQALQIHRKLSEYYFTPENPKEEQAK